MFLIIYFFKNNNPIDKYVKLVHICLLICLNKQIFQKYETIVTQNNCFNLI